jgi:hypothetical protein
VSQNYHIERKEARGGPDIPVRRHGCGGGEGGHGADSGWGRGASAATRTAVESARRRNGEVVGEPALAHSVSVRTARRGAVRGGGVEKGGASTATGREEETGRRWISVGFVDFFFELKHSGRQC